MNRINKKFRISAIVGIVVALLLVVLSSRSMFADNEQNQEESKTQQNITNIQDSKAKKESSHEDNQGESKDLVDKKSDSTRIQEKETRAGAPIQFQDASISNILTGIAPMDGDDTQGNDSSGSNDIVRSFDSVVYPLNINLNTTDGKQHTGIKVRVTGKVKNGVSSDGRILNAKFDTTKNGVYNMANKTSTMQFDIENVKTGSAIGEKIPLNVLGATNQTLLNSEFDIQIMSYKDDTGKEIDISSEKLIKNIKTKDIKVSTKVNIEFKHGVDASKSRWDFDDFTRTTGNKPGEVSVRGVIAYIVPINGRQNLLGSAYPTNNVKFDIS